MTHSDLLFQELQSFDQSKLKKVETNEKSILNPEKSILEAANYDQSKLNKVEAVEKIFLPTDDGKFNKSFPVGYSGATSGFTSGQLLIIKKLNARKQW